MPVLNLEIRRPLLRSVLAQALLLIMATVVVLSGTAFVAARVLLLERAQLQVTTLGQATVDLTEQEFLDIRRQAQAIGRALTDETQVASALPRLRADHPALLAVRVTPEARKETGIVPTIDRDGWQSVTVQLPWNGRSLYADFSVRRLLDRLEAAATAAGRTAEILFAREQEGQLQIVRVTAPAKWAAVSLGSFRERIAEGMLIAKAANGVNLRGTNEDYRGVDVVTSARFLPSLGWGMSAQIDASEVLEGVRFLGMFHVLLGAAFLLLTAVGAVWLARGWTLPIHSLAERVAVLGPGHWDLYATLKTQDETAFLERVMADMASRLRDFTTNLEKLVQQRTQALRRQYELDRTVLESIEYGVLTVDARCAVTGINAAAMRMLGVGDAAALGAAADRLLALTIDGKTLLRDDHPLRTSIATESIVRTEPGRSWTLAIEGREPLSLSLIATPLHAGGKLFGAVAVFQDITRERQMEQLKSEFITLASHQLRTPLSIMQWQLEALHDAHAVDPAQVGEMEGAAKRMTSIVNALLQVAKLEGGALTPVIAPVDLSGLLHESAEEARHGAQNGVQVEVQSIAGLHIDTDVVLLKIILQNLLENAVKYSGDGTTIRVQAQQKGDATVVTVQDAGVGIPQEEQRHVFEKFFRGKNVRKQSTDGTGLGLYIAKMITEQLGGTLTFASAEGTGTTFMVTLPNTS